MATIKVFNMAGKETGTLELLDSVFGIEPNTVVMHEAVKAHLANKRQGTQSTLTRAEVSGGGKKPWRQKVVPSTVLSYLKPGIVSSLSEYV